VTRPDPFPPEYQSFLLRLWRRGACDGWRASLQSTATEQHYHFGTVDELFAFLDARMATTNEGEPGQESRAP
jgi:hypothetical protein